MTLPASPLRPGKRRGKTQCEHGGTASESSVCPGRRRHLRPPFLPSALLEFFTEVPYRPQIYVPRDLNLFDTGIPEKSKIRVTKAENLQ